MKSNILFYWKIGKLLYEGKKSCPNIHIKCSDYLSYYFGDSFRYSLFNINLMRKFYLYFPMYINCMDNIGWSSYSEMLRLKRDECYFYYNVSLFCGDNCGELKDLIQNNVYSRI